MSDNQTTYTIDLPVKGKDKIDAAASAVDVLAARLDAATKAVKVGEAAFRTNEAAADKLARAVEKLGQAADVERAKLAAAREAGNDKAAGRAAEKLHELTLRQTEAATKANVAKASLAEEAHGLDALTAAAKKAADAHKMAQDAGDKSEPAYEKIGRGLRKLGGPLADIGDRVAKVGSGFSKLKDAFGGSAGMWVGATTLAVAFAAAVIAAGVAVVGLTVKIATWAIGLADANRQSSLLAQGIVQSVKGGEALNAEIKSLSRTLPVSNDELADMARNFAYAGLRGKALNSAIEQTAKWSARLKFGPDYLKEMLSLEQQSKIFHANIAALFGGLKIDPLLQGLQLIGELLDENTASGQAIKVVFESIFQPLIDGAAGAKFKVEAFFLQLEIWALQGLIAIKPYGSTILKVAEAFGIGAAVIAGTVVAAFVLLAGAVLAAVAAVGLLWELGVAIGNMFADWIIEIVDLVPKMLMAGSKLGRAVIDGIGQGVKDGASAAITAVEDAATGAVAAAKRLLGIHSPSKVMAAEVGEPMGEGVAVGFERTIPQASKSLEGLVSGSAEAATTGGNSGGGTASARPSFSLTGPFIFNGVKDADDAEIRFGELLTRIIEGDATQLGGVTPATAGT